MPTPFLLLTPQLSFNLTDIPKVFSELEMEYYNKNCGYCKKNSKKNAVCLICGMVMCYTAQSSLSNPLKCLENKDGTGILTWHSKVHEGGCCLFLIIETGTIVAISPNGSSALLDSPYRTKYGQAIQSGQKNPNDFRIDFEGGGKDLME